MASCYFTPCQVGIIFWFVCWCTCVLLNASHAPFWLASCNNQLVTNSGRPTWVSWGRGSVQEHQLHSPATGDMHAFVIHLMDVPLAVDLRGRQLPCCSANPAALLLPEASAATGLMELHSTHTHTQRTHTTKTCWPPVGMDRHTSA